ncbi:MAG: glucose-1-phosphate thymidylyltransferase [Chloroflexota bacterium]
MKAIILAAGQGTRLRPVTLTMPKPVVPVANKRLIEYAIDTIKGAGITEIGIVVNSLESPIVKAFGNGDDLDVKIEYVIQEEQLGLAHAAGICRDFVGDEPFAMFLGDNIFQDKMSDLIRNFESSDADASIVLTPVPDPSRFGIAVVENEKIQEVMEKPENPPSNLAIVGIYLFRPSIFEVIDSLEPSARGEYEITDAIQALIGSGKKVAPYKIKGWFIDAGKPDPIILANQLVLEELPWTPAPTDENKIQGDSDVSHRVIIGENSQIIDSVVRGPVIIGDNTIIRNSYVGPYTAIGDNCTIEGSEIEASIVMSGCRIHLIPGRIDRSLLADNAQVVSTDRMPTAYRFVLAENTIVEV